MKFIPVINQIFKDEVLQIGIEENVALLRLTWLQQPDSANYRRGYQQAIHLAQENNAKFWLTDSRQILYLPLADQHWMYAQMCPLLEAGTLSKFAIVMQPETFMTTDKAPISDKLSNNKKLYNIDLFLELPSARAWLLE
jgi:hypothetical protein